MNSLFWIVLGVGVVAIIAVVYKTAASQGGIFSTFGGLTSGSFGQVHANS